MNSVSFARQVKLLLLKDLALEWRQRFAIQSVMVYMGCAVFICYLSLGIRGNKLVPSTWNAVFWIITLFAAINAVTKSFLQEDKQRTIYYYTIISPQALIVAKIIYNSFLVNVLSLMGFVLYSVMMSNEIASLQQFFVCLILASIGFLLHLL